MPLWHISTHFEAGFFEWPFRSILRRKLVKGRELSRSKDTISMTTARISGELEQRRGGTKEKKKKTIGLEISRWTR